MVNYGQGLVKYGQFSQVWPSMARYWTIMHKYGQVWSSMAKYDLVFAKYGQVLDKYGQVWPDIG